MPNHLLDALSKGPNGQDKNRAPFLLYPNDGMVTYQQFFDDVFRVSQMFVEYDLERDFRVVVIASKSTSVITAYLGAVAAGGVFIPLNDAYTDKEVEYFIRDVQPSILITSPDRLERLRPMASSLKVRHILTMNSNGEGTFREKWQQTRIGNAEPRRDDDLAAILYTSGTTGPPKGAMLSHKALLSNSTHLANLWKFTKHDRLIHALPVHHTHGLFVATHVAMLSGASMVFLPKFDSKVVLHHMRDATTLMGVPTFYTRLLELPELNTSATRNMRLFVSGSAPLDASTHQEWKRRTGHDILERYGMTEANMICSNPYEGIRQPGTVGKPLPGVKIRIRDVESGEYVAPGGLGMLEICSAGLFSGYWRQPKKTAHEMTKDGYLITGDLARINDLGYTIIAGRAKDLIISAGVNLYPKEIEDVINLTPGVAESAVIGIPHPDFGECVVAVVVAKKNFDLDPKTVMATLKDRLARFKHPKQLEIVTTLPRNSLGKVQKSVLRQQYSELFKP